MKRVRVRGWIEAIAYTVLGTGVTALVLLAFGPLGRWACQECEDVGTGLWALEGFIGIAVLVAVIFTLGAMFAVGVFTVEEAQSAKYKLGTWYGKRLLARREAEALEDNGEIE